MANDPDDDEPDADFTDGRPFNNAAERKRIRAGTKKIEQVFPLVAPFIAVVNNRKALICAVSLIFGITILFRPDIATALGSLARAIWEGKL